MDSVPCYWSILGNDACLQSIAELLKDGEEFKISEFDSGSFNNSLSSGVHSPSSTDSDAVEFCTVPPVAPPCVRENVVVDHNEKPLEMKRNLNISSVSKSKGRVCVNCRTTETPLWRRSEAGSLLCNACGLYQKQYSKPRPIVERRQSGKKKSSTFPNQLRCKNCNTTETSLWRRVAGPNGVQETHCNACGLYQRIHNIPRPIRPGSQQPLKRRSRGWRKSLVPPEEVASSLPKWSVSQSNPVKAASPNQCAEPAAIQQPGIHTPATLLTVPFDYDLWQAQTAAWDAPVTDSHSWATAMLQQMQQCAPLPMLYDETFLTGSLDIGNNISLMPHVSSYTSLLDKLLQMQALTLQQQSGQCVI